MGLRTILLLLCAVGGLSAVLMLTDEKPKTVNLAEPLVLDGRSLAQCIRMRWQFHNQPPIEVIRDAEGRFQLAEPLVDLASAAYMKQIVDAWSSASMRKTPLVDDADGRKRAGLEPPELTFMAEFPDGVRIEVEIGSQGPLGQTRFLRRDGKIWEGGDALVESMRVGLDDLRERTVYRHTPPQVYELRVDQASPTGKRETIHLKLENNVWRLLSPIVGRADRVAAQGYLVSLLSQRVDYFPAGLLRPRTDAPDIVVTVRGVQGEETINLWKTEDAQLFGFMPHRNLYFLSDNRQYSQIFQASAEILRARILVSLGDNASVYDSLAELVVDPGQGRGDRLRLRRESPAAEWRLLEPVEFATNPSAGTDAAQAVNNLVVQEFVADEGALEPAAKDPRYGLGAGRLQVSVRGFEQKEATELWLGSKTTRNQFALHYACRADEPDTVVLVPEQAVETLLRAWTEYCARRVLTITGIGELEVQRGDAERRIFKLEGTRWICEGVEGDRAEVGDFANEHLRDLTAKRVLDARGEAFARAAWTLTIKRQTRDRLAGLDVFEPTPDGPLLVRVAGRPDMPAIAFELSALDSRLLRQLWQ